MKTKKPKGEPLAYELMPRLLRPPGKEAPLRKDKNTPETTPSTP